MTMATLALARIALKRNIQDGKGISAALDAAGRDTRVPDSATWARLIKGGFLQSRPSGLHLTDLGEDVLRRAGVDV